MARGEGCWVFAHRLTTAVLYWSFAWRNCKGGNHPIVGPVKPMALGSSDVPNCMLWSHDCPFSMYCITCSAATQPCDRFPGTHYFVGTLHLYVLWCVTTPSDIPSDVQRTSASDWDVKPHAWQGTSQDVTVRIWGCTRTYQDVVTFSCPET